MTILYLSDGTRIVIQEEQAYIEEAIRRGGLVTFSLVEGWDTNPIGKFVHIAPAHIVRAAFV